jgi:hypothetical protein
VEPEKLHGRYQSDSSLFKCFQIRIWWILNTEDRTLQSPHLTEQEEKWSISLTQSVYLWKKEYFWPLAKKKDTWGDVFSYFSFGCTFLDFSVAFWARCLNTSFAHWCGSWRVHGCVGDLSKKQITDRECFQVCSSSHTFRRDIYHPTERKWNLPTM